MKIQTLNFGTQTIDSSDIISFPKGFIGFESQKEFKLFHEENDNPTVHWLQSITDEAFSMSIVSPEAFGLDYEITLNDDEQALLNIDNSDDVVVALIVYKQYDESGNTSDENLKVMAKAPVIINIKDKLGLQKPLDVINVKTMAA